MQTNDYKQRTADWREQLRKNSRKTVFAIGVFILTYIAVGLLVDVFIQYENIQMHAMRAAQYYGSYASASPSLSHIFISLITFKTTPIATFIMFGIALISIFVTFTMYDRIMLLGTQYRQITQETAHSLQEKQLYNTVEELKIAAGMQYMPRVFIIEADYMNAFASGYSEKSAMVAITRGLMTKLSRDELQAVMAHEISHIRHMDIKLTLAVSVLSNIMLITLDMLFYGALFSGRSERGRGGNVLFLIIMLARFIVPLLNVVMILYLSRTREYMADAGAVELMRTNEPMARALLKISGDHMQHRQQYAAAYKATPHESVRKAAYIFDPTKAGISPAHAFTDVFSTHPSIKKRLEAIGFKQ